jgi:ABC-type uncharacterized transport system ATPase subunit
MLQPHSSRLHVPLLGATKGAAAAAGAATGRKLLSGQEAAASAGSSWVRTAAPGQKLPALAAQQQQEAQQQAGAHKQKRTWLAWQLTAAEQQLAALMKDFEAAAERFPATEPIQPEQEIII